MLTVTVSFVFLVAISPNEELKNYIAAHGSTYSLLGKADSPDNEHTAYAWSQNPMLLSNFYTLISVAKHEDDLLSKKRVDLFVTKYRPLLEISWLSESAIAIKCISLLANEAVMAIPPEAAQSGYTITYTTVKPVEITKSLAISPANEFALSFFHRSWDAGTASVSEIFVRPLLDSEEVGVNIKLHKSPLDPDNDKVIFRVRGLRELRYNWPEPNTLEIDCDNAHAKDILIKEVSEGKLLVNYKNITASQEQTK